MKTKKSIFLSLALASVLVLVGCNNNKTPTSEQSQPTSESSSGGPKTYTVRFLVGGEVVQTSQVVSGEYASYDGSLVVSETDDPNVQTRIKAWDKDIKKPITKDTDFNAVTADYGLDQMVDDFETYTSTGRLLEANWQALTLNGSGQWTTETSAAVSLGVNATSGKQCIRLDCWTNSCDYKIAKVYDVSPFEYCTNAIKFSVMSPSYMTTKIILQTEAMEIDGKYQSPYFSYLLDKGTGEYVDYVIPLDDPNWCLYGEAGKSIADAAGWVGIHQDDLLKYLARIEIFVKGPTLSGGAPVEVFLDNVRFVTLDKPEFMEDEHMKSYTTYTGVTKATQTVKISLTDETHAKADVLGTPVSIPGTYVIEDKQITFTSDDGGDTLVYTGKLTNGGQRINFVSASGQIAEDVQDMELNAIQVLDDYEGYDEDGTAWWNGNKDNPEQRSGCRGAYYSEYYSGDANDSTEWGGSKWSLLRGNGDQLKLAGNAENHYLSLKSSSGAAMRYMPWGMYDGSAEKVAYRGSKFSFWAKSEGVVTHLKVFAYSQSAPKNATKDTRVRTLDLTQTDSNNYVEYTEWTHFEFDINPDLVYYGFVILMDWNRTYNNATLFVDNVEIYTASPYAPIE